MQLEALPLNVLRAGSNNDFNVLPASPIVNEILRDKFSFSRPDENKLGEGGVL